MQGPTFLAWGTAVFIEAPTLVISSEAVRCSGLGAAFIVESPVVHV
jgi:hypothetical protein